MADVCFSKPEVVISHAVNCDVDVTLAIFFDEKLTSCDLMTALSKPYYYNIRELWCIRVLFISIPKQPPTLSILNFTTVILYSIPLKRSN